MNGSRPKAKKQKYRKLSPSELEDADEQELPPGRLCRVLSVAFEALMFGVFAILLMGFAFSFFGVERVMIPWIEVEVTNFDHKLALLGLMVYIHRSIVSRWRPKEG